MEITSHSFLLLETKPCFPNAGEQRSPFEALKGISEYRSNPFPVRVKALTCRATTLKDYHGQLKRFQMGDYCIPPPPRIVHTNGYALMADPQQGSDTRSKLIIRKHCSSNKLLLYQMGLTSTLIEVAVTYGLIGPNRVAVQLISSSSLRNEGKKK